jgi:hypothetical protein
LLSRVDRTPLSNHVNSSQRYFLRRVFNSIPNPIVSIMPNTPHNHSDIASRGSIFIPAYVKKHSFHIVKSM